VRIGARQRAQIEAELSARDRDVLEKIDGHRYLTTAHVTGFCFTDHASSETAARVARRVLHRLKRDGLLRPLTRRVGGVRAGSSATIWRLTPAGRRLLTPTDPKAGNWRSHEPSPRFLGHCLAVADSHLTLLSLAGRAGVTKVTVAVEPDSWRRYIGPGGEARSLHPDLSSTVHGRDHEGDYVDHWYIEVDQGTESLPTLLRKCEQYEAYAATGIDQQRLGTSPLVLWVFTGPEHSVCDLRLVAVGRWTLVGTASRLRTPCWTP
jgi:hypothetical protein